MWPFRLFFFFIFFSFLFLDSFSQESIEENENQLTITEIVFEGNKITKEFVIRRELSIQEGDQVSREDTSKVFLIERNKIFNIGLFHRVKVYATKVDSSDLRVTIWVIERFRFIDSRPIVEVGDRNFNEWWNDRGRDLGRLNLGLKFKNNNFRGRKETLGITAQLGFTRKFQATYSVPYINKNYNTGLSFSFSYDQARSVSFRNFDLNDDSGNIEFNKLGFSEHNDIITQSYTGVVEIVRRVGFFENHKGSLSFYNNQVKDTIVKLNDNYFDNNSSQQNYLELKYTYDYDKRDVRYYPLKGNRFSLEFTKRGVGIFGDLNQWVLKSDYNKFWSLGKKFYTAIGVTGQTTFPSNQGYFNSRGLGFGFDYVRGYELNVINGEHYGLVKTSAKKQLLSRLNRINMPWMPIKDLQYIPLGFYLKTFFDTGYSVDTNPSFGNKKLANKFLTAYGVGVDFISFFDFITSVEYSINREGDTNLFIRFSAGIK